MSVVNGINGSISLGGTTVSTLTDWRINYTAANVSRTASNTGGFPITLKGVTDWTLAAQVADKTLPATPGTSYAFVGYNGAERVTGTVICQDFSLECDIEGGGILSATSNFGGSGALTFPGTLTVLTDSSAPRVYSAIGAKATWTPIVGGTAGTEADIPDVRTWSLSLTCDVQPYNSSTAGGVTTRVAGGKKMGSATLDFYQSALSYLSAAGTSIVPGAYGILKLYVNATEFYQLSYVVVGDNGNIGAGAEAATLNNVTLSFMYTSFTNVSGTMTRGTILLPDGSAYFS
jgi:hypothetical protein